MAQQSPTHFDLYAFTDTARGWHKAGSNIDPAQITNLTHAILNARADLGLRPIAFTLDRAKVEMHAADADYKAGRIGAHERAYRMQQARAENPIGEYRIVCSNNLLRR